MGRPNLSHGLDTDHEEVGKWRRSGPRGRRPGGTTRETGRRTPTSCASTPPTCRRPRSRECAAAGDRRRCSRGPVLPGDGSRGRIRRARGAGALRGPPPAGTAGPRRGPGGTAVSVGNVAQTRPRSMTPRWVRTGAPRTPTRVGGPGRLVRGRGRRRLESPHGRRAGRAPSPRPARGPDIPLRERRAGSGVPVRRGGRPHTRDRNLSCSASSSSRRRRSNLRDRRAGAPASAATARRISPDCRTALAAGTREPPSTGPAYGAGVGRPHAVRPRGRSARGTRPGRSAVSPPVGAVRRPVPATRAPRRDLGEERGGLSAPGGGGPGVDTVGLEVREAHDGQLGTPTGSDGDGAARREVRGGPAGACRVPRSRGSSRQR